MPIPRLAAMLLAALLAATATATAQQTAYVTRGLAATGTGVFTVVRDTTTGEDFVLGRDPVVGGVTARFGGGYAAAAIGAAADDTVYVAGTDAAVRVYTASGARYELADTWPVASPVAGQVLVPTGIVPAGDGVLVAFGAPGGFRGVVALDGAGRAIATWPVPDETLPAGVSLSPEAITAVGASQFVVQVPPCRDTDCSGAAPDGYAYEIALATPTGAPATLTTVRRWQDPLLARVGDLAANTRATFLAVVPDSDPHLVGLLLAPAGGVTPSGAVPTAVTPATRVATTGVGLSGSAFVLEGLADEAGVVIERFAPLGTGWASAGTPWTASWGSAGPPEPPTCDGRTATIVGTQGDDVIRGTRRTDVIVARGGDDVVRGGGGADYLCLGTGDDVAAGGPGADLVMGGRGADRLTGGAGHDLIGGGPGRDTAAGGAGRDRCRAETVRRCEL